MIGKLGKEVKALKKILIVEDDQLLNRTLAYNLTSDGYEVISVFNFDSAVRKLRENEFDVALLDINLPDGSGLDLCEEIRNRGQHTYIIFITANDKESDMLKGYEVGGADYVTKQRGFHCHFHRSRPYFAKLLCHRKNVQKSPGELSLSKGFPGVQCYDLVGSTVMPIAI